MKAPKNSRLLPSLPQADEIQDNLDAIMAIADLLGNMDTSQKLEPLHDRTIADAALLIQRETLNISRLLGLGRA